MIQVVRMTRSPPELVHRAADQPRPIIPASVACPGSREVAVLKRDGAHDPSLHRDPQPLNGAVGLLPQLRRARPVSARAQLVADDHVPLIGERRPGEPLHARGSAQRLGLPLACIGERADSIWEAGIQRRVLARCLRGVPDRFGQLERLDELLHLGATDAMTMNVRAGQLPDRLKHRGRGPVARVRAPWRPDPELRWFGPDRLDHPIEIRAFGSEAFAARRACPAMLPWTPTA